MSLTLQDESTSVHEDALALSGAAVTAQANVQETIIRFNTTSSSALSLLKASLPSLEYAVNLSRLINESEVPNSDVVALAFSANSTDETANQQLIQARNIR